MLTLATTQVNLSHWGEEKRSEKEPIERKSSKRAVAQRRVCLVSSLSFGDNLDLKLQAEFLA